MRILDFTHRDLRANRAGKLSKRQRLATRTRHWRMPLTVFLLLMFAIAANPDPGVMFLTFTGVGSVALIGWAAWQQYLIDRYHPTDRRVHAITGRVHTFKRKAEVAGNIIETYHVAIGDVEFQHKNKRLLTVFEDGAVYTAYYTSGKLLSAERTRG